MTSELFRILRFLMAGLLNTGFGYACYAAFVLIKAPIWLAVGGSTVLAILFNFASYGGLVFGNMSSQVLPRFLLFYTGLGALNFGLLNLLAHLGLGLLLAQALLLPVLAGVGYYGMRSLVFRDIKSEAHMDDARVTEEFKPIPVRWGKGPWAPVLFRLRMSLDLQLLTCTRFLEPQLKLMCGSVLDVGCGEMPFRGFLGPDVRYTGIDVPQAADFGMSEAAGIIAFDGRRIPFPDASFDHVMCVEVLEHAQDPDALITEMNRVLRPGGSLLVTVPFSARVHHAPYDFHRFTRFRLGAMFADFADTEIRERGDDIAVIANKLIVVCMRLAGLHTLPTLLPRLAGLAILAPIALAALILAHLSLLFGWGSRMDPLGYSISARKV